MIDVREDAMVNGTDLDMEVALPENLDQEAVTLLFSEAVGARHLLRCNAIANVPDPVSGKRVFKIVARLFDKSNCSKPLGEKCFFWPEVDVPDCKIEQNPNLLLIMKGKKNVVELPFAIPKNSFLILSSTTKLSSPVVTKSSFTGASQRIEGMHALLMGIREFVSSLDEDRWKNLVKICSADGAPKVLPFVTPDSLLDFEQLTLMDTLLQKIKTKQQEGQVIMVFTVLLKNKVFSANTYPEIVKKLIEAKNFKLLLMFVKSPSTLVMDNEYVEVIKFALESKEDQCCDLFVELVSKGFTIGTIRDKFAKNLTPKEAIEVLNWSINILDRKANDDHICQSLLDLMLALLDSQCDKLVMDDECYAALKRAKDYVQSMTEMTTAFTRLLSKNRAKTEIPQMEASSDTDFIIEKVKFIKTAIF